MLVQDELSGEAVSFHVGRDTTIKSSNGSGKPELLPGSLVKLSFVPGKDSRQVREINILAQPGGEFVFAGVITNIDLHLGTLSVANTSDNRTYDIRFDPASTPNLNRLKIGVQVIVNARFSGRDYRASHITVQQSSPASSQAQAQPQAQ